MVRYGDGNLTVVGRVRRILVFVALGLAVSGLILLWANFSTNRAVRVMNEQTMRMVVSSDAEIKEIEEKKAAELLRLQKAAKAASESSRLASLNSYDGITLINPNDCNSAVSHMNPGSIDVVVNKKHCMKPLGYYPSDLMAIDGGSIRRVAYKDFNAMLSAAAYAGQPFRVTSGFRSYQSQVDTYNHWVSVSGTLGADTYSARPGYSEHQTGLVIDVAAGSCVLDCFGSTSQYKWMQDNAHKYGFIQRYYAGKESITGYSAEEWHYRYVGVATATDMKSRGVKTLEEYWSMPGGDYEAATASH